jgi:hypothetical protein
MGCAHKGRGFLMPGELNAFAANATATMTPRRGNASRGRFGLAGLQDVGDDRFHPRLVGKGR